MLRNNHGPQTHQRAQFGVNPVPQSRTEIQPSRTGTLNANRRGCRQLTVLDSFASARRRNSPEHSETPRFDNGRCVPDISQKRQAAMLVVQFVYQRGTCAYGGKNKRFGWILRLPDRRMSNERAANCASEATADAIPESPGEMASDRGGRWLESGLGRSPSNRRHLDGRNARKNTPYPRRRLAAGDPTLSVESNPAANITHVRIDSISIPESRLARTTTTRAYG